MYVTLNICTNAEKRKKAIDLMITRIFYSWIDVLLVCLLSCIWYQNCESVIQDFYGILQYIEN